MVAGQKLYKTAGMERSAVILNIPITTAQFRDVARQSGIYAWERCFGASTVSDWQAKAVDWVKNGVDPDHARAARISAPMAHSISYGVLNGTGWAHWARC